MLFPNSNAPSRREGCLTKDASILADNRPLFLSSSIFNLLELTKAISIPEKKAEKNKDIITISQLLISFYFSSGLTWNSPDGFLIV